MEENGLWRKVQKRDAAKLERIRRWLERSLEAGVLSPVARAAGGQVLALLGDRRPGVGLGPDGLPDVDWVEVPAGPFLMGPDPGPFSKAERVKPDLPSYRISRYPVTNSQYQAFVEDAGYGEEWRHCWSEEGWQWKADRKAPNENLPAERLLANHPRVNVCWYEAHAFCGWLGERLGHEVRLPSEAEWEKAARGTDGRDYPWEGEFDVARCNCGHTGIGTTSAVGAFPSGTSPHGVLDLSGNVWEWCSTKWRDSYKEPVDEETGGKASRLLRGGSFLSRREYVRCAFRASYSPRFVDTDFGFRVSAPIF